MLVNKMLMNVTEILLVIFAIFLFSCYFSIFYKKKEKDNNCNWLHHFCSLAVNAFECQYITSLHQYKRYNCNNIYFSYVCL